MITAGSSDRFLYIWDTTSKKILHRLSGHNGSVNDVQFSPTHNIVASASTDRNIIIGNIPSYTL
jgi:Prp8 binding protein